MFLQEAKDRFVHSCQNQLALGMKAFRDPAFYGFLSLGLAGWFSGSIYDRLAWEWLLLKAFFEEFFFRFLLQETLDRMLNRARVLGPLTAANLITSLAFALMHLPRQSPAWAAMTFVPSLIFGLVWDRYKSVLPAWIVHFGYNFLLFHRAFI